MRECVVRQVVRACQHCDHADTGEEQQSDSNQQPEDARRYRAAQRLGTEDEAIENEAGGEDHARLKASARPVIAMKLDVKCK